MLKENGLRSQAASWKVEAQGHVPVLPRAPPRSPRGQRPAQAPKRSPRDTPAPPLCFECYRVDLARERALQAARHLNTASEARFQDSLPFEPINRARLERLRAERATVRAA